MEASTIIIGGGIVGTAIARELSKYSVKVVLIEKEADIAFGGATKANTAIIHAGYDDKPGTLTAELCQRGNALWSKLAYELNIPLRRIGSLVVALEDGETSILEELMERGKRNHVRELRIVEGKQLFETESILNRAAIAGLYAPTAGVISPYQAAIALTENAEENGVTILLGTKVTDVIVKDGEVKGVKTNKGNVYARYVINAAGLFADEVSTMAGIEGVKIVPRKGEYVVYDKGLSGLVNHVLFPVPTMMGKGIAVTPTVDGNIIAGPTANDIHDKDDRATTPLGLGEVLEDAYRLVPKLSAMRDTIITCFAGLRPQPTTDDFIIRAYEKLHGFVNVVGIKSPGLTSAPAIAMMVVDILRKEGLRLEEKDSFKQYRRPIVQPLHDLNLERAEKCIAKDSRYGHVVCRCESVTEAEIVEAIHRGGSTLDGVKNRTRAGMGRCQGGFCTPHVIKLIAQELQIPVEAVTKKGGNSRILQYPVKKLLGVAEKE